MQREKTLFERLLMWIITAGSAVYLLTFFVIAFQQIRYPYELEWMEGGMVDQVAQVIAGNEMYRAPDISFVPYTYTPLYFHICAWLSGYTGPGFLPLRLVAFVSSVGCMAMIFLFVRRETRSSFYAFLSCSLFAAMYRLGGCWYTVARADMLLFFLMLVGIYLLCGRKESVIKTCAAAVLFCLAFFCKQTALFVAAPLALYTLLFFRGFNRFVFILILGLVIPLSTWQLNLRTDGWYGFYVFDLPGNHKLVPFRMLSFWIKDIIAPLFIACCLCASYAIGLMTNKNFKKLFFAFFVLGGLVGVSFLVRIRTGSFVNTVLPAYLGVALYFGIAAHYVMTEWYNSNENTCLQTTGLLACLAQLLLLFYDPTVLIPTRDDRAAGDHLIALIKQFPGDVYVPGHGYYNRLAGKSSFAQQVASYDIERSDRSDIVAPFTNALHTAIRDGRFDAVILDYPWYDDSMAPYEYRGDLFSNDEIFWPITGRRIRPKAVHVRKDIDIDLTDWIQKP